MTTLEVVLFFSMYKSSISYFSKILSDSLQNKVILGADLTHQMCFATWLLHKSGP